MGDGDSVQACCYMLFFCISLVCYIVQMVSQSHVVPPHGSGLVPNGTTPATCAWKLHLHNKTYNMECGKDCKKECGFCDPQYDNCFGKKYCPVKCDNGLPCIYMPGELKSDCKGICSRESVCVPLPPPKATVGEVQYHILMTCVYLFITISSVCLGGCAEKHAWRNSDRLGHMHYEFAFVAFMLFVISGSFLLATTVSDDELSMYNSRFITMMVFYIVLVTVLARCIGYRSVGNANKGGHSALFFYMWFIMGVIEILQCVIGKSHATLYALGEDFYPFVAETRRCSQDEYFAYTGWVGIFGLLEYAFACLAANFRAGQNHVMENFFTVLSVPGSIVWLIAVSFYGACKNNGFTVIVPFVISITACFVLFVGLNVAWIVRQHKRQRQSQDTLLLSDNSRGRDDIVYGSAAESYTLAPDFEGDASAPVAQDAEKGEEIIVAPDAETTVEQFLREVKSLEYRCFRCIQPSHFTLLFLVLEYLAVGWTMYVVREEVKQKQ